MLVLHLLYLLYDLYYLFLLLFILASKYQLFLALLPLLEPFSPVMPLLRELGCLLLDTEGWLVVSLTEQRSQVFLPYLNALLMLLGH